jgi:hypothetical protein
MPETLEEIRRATDDVIRRAIANAMSGAQGAEPSAARGASGPRRTLRTGDAARYLGLSGALLRKYRKMGPGDPGVHGPAFIKISASIVLYEIAALDDWLDSRRLAALERNARP